MNNKQKEIRVNRLAQAMGNALAKSGHKMIRSSFHLEPTIQWGNKLYSFIKNTTEFKNTTITIADAKYHFIPFSQWKEIIRVDWTDQKKYIGEVYDCDNFSFSFTSRMGEIFNINTAGVVYGVVHDKDTNRIVARHYWNAIVAQGEDNKLELYFYEPITDKYTKYEAGKDIIIGQWKYKCLSFRFY